ncbi:MAG: cupin [Proteobacteria bacterium]|nr:cupin [Pseudomonadota bacterium]
MDTNLHLDFEQRLSVQTMAMDWTPSPAVGVWRKPLEREHAESGRTTSVVRYAPGSSFAAHVHARGEEIFVLNGTFEDEYGCYRAGTYVRNPPASSHAPRSALGCELFVKLSHFAPGDDERIVIDTTVQPWLPGLVDGLRVMPLAEFRGEHTALVRWAPNTFFNRHRHWGGEEIFVLDGVFSDEHGHYPAGSWLRSPHNSQHEPYSREGCTILVKVGHLPEVHAV